MLCVLFCSIPVPVALAYTRLFIYKHAPISCYSDVQGVVCAHQVQFSLPIRARWHNIILCIALPNGKITTNVAKSIFCIASHHQPAGEALTIIRPESRVPNHRVRCCCCCRMTMCNFDALYIYIKSRGKQKRNPTLLISRVNKRSTMVSPFLFN